MKLIKAAFFALIIGCCLLWGCDKDDDDNGTGSGSGTGGNAADSAAGKGALTDWTIVPGWENEYSAEEMTVSAGTAPDGSNAMKVTWGSSKDLRMADLYAKLPAGYDYGYYDGLIFEVWAGVCQLMMSALRNPPINSTPGNMAGTAWRIEEKQYRYNGDWRIIVSPLDPAADVSSEWGTIPASESYINQWLTENKDTEIILTLNPELCLIFADEVELPAVELPIANAVDTTYTNYYKRIGFYKSESYDDPDLDTDEICWVWEF